MGTVWAAKDTRLGRKVVVKQIRRDLSADSGVMRRFQREAQVTARLSHPGIPAVYDFGVAGTDMFIVMEHVDGVTIADLVNEVDPVPVPWAAAITAQVCAALAAAHQQLLVHRDIKPSNVMIRADGSVKVLDFGLAAAVVQGEFSQITVTGETPGTAFYMAPEVAAGAAATQASDLYSVGCLLYELLTGWVVFADLGPVTGIRAHLTQQPRPVQSYRAEVPPPIAALTMELLANDPAARPPDARAVFTRLLPHATDLPPMPGIIAASSAPNPAQLYAILQARIAAPLPRVQILLNRSFGRCLRSVPCTSMSAPGQAHDLARSGLCPLTPTPAAPVPAVPLPGMPAPLAPILAVPFPAVMPCSPRASGCSGTTRWRSGGTTRSSGTARWSSSRVPPGRPQRAPPRSAS
jgi:serine/threonine protein kinase